MQQIFFVLVLAVASYFAYRYYYRVYRNIFLGKKKEIGGDVGQRWKNVALVAFGQKKMFKRIIPATLHLFIYVAFLMTQVELIEIILDGILGTHRLFADALGVLYTIIISFIEILSLLALVATIAFLWRRNLLKIPRLVKSELDGWPKLDANLILIGELLLVTGIFTMNGTDVLLQQIDSAHFPDTGTLAVSSWLGPMLFDGMSTTTLYFLERSGWWLHIMVVLGFIVYLPFSKHLHIFLAFPNVYYSKLTSRGTMENMPMIMNEVKSMMGIETDAAPADANAVLSFGSKDVTDLSWKNILDAYTCTECGRCTDNCPANMTGKKLSPRKIMMDVRDRAEEIGCKLDAGDQVKETYDDGSNLFNLISDEELFACTTCNACVEACPVMIDPLDIIMELRRYRILTDAAGPSDWLPMFTSLENSGAVWQMPVERSAWTKDLTN